MKRYNDENLLRVVRFQPYLKGRGPRFTLRVWDTYRREWGRSFLGYELKQGREVLFTGEDFSAAPFLCIDSDNIVESIMGFLTLRPGDTDEDYFAGYTPAQLAYCDAHAESLSACVMDWYERRSK